MARPKVISAANQKGGVGKSATVYSLGAGLALDGKKALLLDVDPQGDLTKGNTAAAKIPVFNSPPAAPAATPTNPGPEEQPRSPASAIRAYIAVPPAGKAFAAAMLNVPGQKIPTEKPRRAQPTNPSGGRGANAARA